jgi:hypothetical protein
VRQSGLLFDAESVGFRDKSLWEKARTTGRAAMTKLIRDGLHGTSATVVLIGEETADRPWVQFEIQESLDRNNALVGVRIHRLLDRNRRASRRGRTPDLLKQIGAPVYDWEANPEDLGEWVERAVIEQCT